MNKTLYCLIFIKVDKVLMDILHHPLLLVEADGNQGQQEEVVGNKQFDKMEVLHCVSYIEASVGALLVALQKDHIK